jgi:hypothetical protein
MKTYNKRLLLRQLADRNYAVNDVIAAPTLKHSPAAEASGEGLGDRVRRYDEAICVNLHLT